MSLFSRDYIKTEISIYNILTCFSTSVQYLHSAWFLDGRPSVLACI